ncbi:MAG TPA: MMPL family transporter [Bacteroidia bacterium]|nr:MMPL family transporter [Bacteroidia bacterium]
MWASIAKIILRNRWKFVTVIAVITLFMAYKATQVQLTYEFAQLLPQTDSTSIEYQNFKNRFGLDGNVMVIGMQEDSLYRLNEFNDWCKLSDAIQKIKGIRQVVSVGRLYNLTKNDSLGKFEFKPLIKKLPTTQQQLDSLKIAIHRLPFYSGFIYNEKTHSTLMAITFEKKDLNTNKRITIVDSIKLQVDQFSKKYKADVHYSGMPYIRTMISRKIASEMVLFLALAVLVTAIILLLFFRSFLPVIFSLLVVLIGVIWSVGTMVLLGYKITALSGLIPPLIIVIGIPNCILLLNKYHTEYNLHHNQALALSRTIEKIGVSLFFANITTAIGFAVFCFTRTQILYEFGLISSLNVIAAYFISLTLIPIVFSFLKPPTIKHTNHLKGKNISILLQKVDYLVHNHRRTIYGTVIVIVIISFVGLEKIKAIGYVVDDLPKKDPIYVDMRYFEKNFNGVLPFEISIDTKKPNGVFADNGRTLYKIEMMQRLFAKYPEFSKPMSIIEGIKFSYQALKDGNPKFYRLPGALELADISSYASDAKSKQNSFKAFIDSTKRYTRVSIQMKDVGSVKMKQLVSELRPRIDTVFNYDRDAKKWASTKNAYKVVLTGNSLMFLKGNDFLVKNLIESVFLAILLITMVMFTLFMSFRMVIISIVPSLIPLLITAGLMGFFHIHLKPSTILIFSIAFGIASDGNMYFLTKYRQEFKNNHYSISKTVSHTIRETGVSMVYTAIILFCGFAIFTASSFEGTAALGLLISVTLLLAYCSNLILLPCFLLSLEKRLTTKAFLSEPLIQIYDEEEDINVNNLTIEKTDEK